MVKRINLSKATIRAILGDVEKSCGKDVIGDIKDAPIFTLIPLDDNQVVVGVDGSLKEVNFKEKPLRPRSLISAAIFVGEGSRYTHMTIDGVSFSIRGRR